MLRDRQFRRSRGLATGAALAAALIALAGCDGGKERGSAPAGEGGHHHVAPHGGALVVLGEEFAHVEVLFDPASGRAEAYILDAHAEKGVPIAALELRVAVEGIADPLILRAVGSTLTGEEPGRSSRFEGVWPELARRERFAATLEAVTVRGVEFRDVSFRFPEGNEGEGAHDAPGAEDDDHGHDDHDHGHDGHDH